MLTNAARSSLLSIGLVCAAVVGLIGCGGGSTSTTTTPSAATTPSTAPAQSAAAASSAATARPSPVVGGVCTPAPIKFDPKAIDLTGAWAGDDGGIYYVRQRDNVVWWNGMSSRDDPPPALGRVWNNVGRGQLKDLTISSDWVDVPRGGIDGYGTVNFKVGADAAGNIQITKTSETGTGRGDTVWTRCTPGFPG